MCVCVCVCVCVLQVRAGMNWQNGNYEVITDDTYQAHEQVFLSYGPHDNTTLFLHYGFTLPYNIHNKVCFSVGENFFGSSILILLHSLLLVKGGRGYLM